MNHGFRNRDPLRTIVLAIATVIVAGGCSLPFEWAGSTPDSWDDTSLGSPEEGNGTGDGSAPGQELAAQVLTVSGPSFTLAWDSESAAVTGYRVYSRPHGTSDWQVVAQNVSEPQWTVSEGDLPYGLYEFAVSSLSADDLESELHHSYDTPADPEPWILEWIAL
jgi:hypothetical protein